MTPSEVADALGKSSNTIKQKLWQMFLEPAWRIRPLRRQLRVAHSRTSQSSLLPLAMASLNTRTATKREVFPEPLGPSIATRFGISSSFE